MRENELIDGIKLKESTVSEKMLVPLHEDYLRNENYREIALECGKRCADYNTSVKSAAFDNQAKMSYISAGEQLCFSRCYNKFNATQKLVDEKMVKVLNVERPLLFGQATSPVNFI